MTRLAERLLKLVRKPHSVSMMVMGIVIVTPADTTRRIPGYGGVLSLPVVEATDTLSLNARIDQILDRRDARADRGRVLYAACHEPAAKPSSTRRARTTRAKVCPPPTPESVRIAKPSAPSPLPTPPPPPQQTVVQGRTPTAPNS